MKYKLVFVILLMLLSCTTYAQIKFDGIYIFDNMGDKVDVEYADVSYGKVKIHKNFDITVKVKYVDVNHKKIRFTVLYEYVDQKDDEIFIYDESVIGSDEEERVLIKFDHKYMTVYNLNKSEIMFFNFK